MDMALILGQQVLTMLLYLIVGVIAYKSKIITYEQSKGMSSVLLYVLSPCMLLKAFKMDYDPDKLMGLLFSTGTTLLAAIFLIVIARYVFFRKDTELAPIERSSVTYTNSGYLAIPLISATLGNEAVFYSCGYLIVFNLLVWTHCIRQMSAGKASVQIKSIITNPNLIAIVIGIILFRFNIKLPTVIDTAVSGFGNMVGPVALFIIGVTLATMDIKQIFLNKRAYWVSLVRLVFAPVLLILFFKVLNINHWIANGDIVINTVLISSFAPVAVIVTMFAQKFDLKADYSSQLVSLSTLLCIITMPVMLLISQIVLG